MEKKEISLEERKVIQLEMLEEIHNFCVKHGIRYSLAYGTLIGAVRHNGYIPWDDDVDLMMPLPDLLKFKEIFRSEKLKLCDVDTEKHYEFPFPRISFTKTYNKVGLSTYSYGVNIDLYPVISLPIGNNLESFISYGMKLYKIRFFFMKMRSRFITRLPISTIPFHDIIQKKFRDLLIKNTPEYGTTNTFYVIGGVFEKKEISKCTYNYDLFTDIEIHKFENLYLNISSKYHDFLTHYYGDYMQLPPEEDRHPYHGGRYYWF